MPRQSRQPGYSAISSHALNKGTLLGGAPGRDSIGPRSLHCRCRDTIMHDRVVAKNRPRCRPAEDNKENDDTSTK